MYQADRFLELSRENLGEQVSEEIVEEIREVRRRDKLAHQLIQEKELYRHLNMKRMHLNEELKSVQHQMLNFEKEMHELQHKRSMLESEKSNLKEYRNKVLHEGGSEHIDDNQLTDHYYIVSKNHEEVMRSLDISRMRYKKLKQHLVILEEELNHGRKIIEQEDSMDS